MNHPNRDSRRNHPLMEQYHLPALIAGDYAEYTGMVRGSATLRQGPQDVTIKVQVVATNPTSVEWMQSGTTLADRSQSTYWVR